MRESLRMARAMAIYECFSFGLSFGGVAVVTYPLSLASGELEASFADLGVVLLWEGHNAFVDVRRLACPVDVGLGGVRLGIHDVVHDGVVKKNRVLWDNTDVLPQPV